MAKLLLIFAMLLGRHRGLPDNIDAARTPNLKDMQRLLSPDAPRDSRVMKTSSRGEREARPATVKARERELWDAVGMHSGWMRRFKVALGALERVK